MADNGVFPVPTQEKVVRWGLWLGCGLLALAGINAVGPMAILAVTNLFDLTTKLIALGALAVGGTVAFATIAALVPAIKTLINTLAYKANEVLIEAYPIVQMKLWLKNIQDGVAEAKTAEQTTLKIVAENKKKVGELEKSINELVLALKDPGLTEEERNSALEELAVTRKERDLYQGPVDDLSPMAATMADFILFQEKIERALGTDIRLATTELEISEQTEKVVNIFNSIFGKSAKRQNYVAARDLAKTKYSTSIGKMASIRKQMDTMVKAAQAKDHISLAAARQELKNSFDYLEVSEKAKAPERLQVRQLS